MMLPNGLTQNELRHIGELPESDCAHVEKTGDHKWRCVDCFGDELENHKYCGDKDMFCADCKAMKVKDGEIIEPEIEDYDPNEDKEVD